MWQGTASWGNSLAVSQIVKSILTMQPSNSTSGQLPTNKEITCPYKRLAHKCSQHPYSFDPNWKQFKGQSVGE